MLFHMCLFLGKAWSKSWIGNGELDPICSLLSHGLNDDPVSHRRLDKCECQAPGIANMLCLPAGSMDFAGTFEGREVTLGSWMDLYKYIWWKLPQKMHGSEGKRVLKETGCWFWPTLDIRITSVISIKAQPFTRKGIPNRHNKDPATSVLQR